MEDIRRMTLSNSQVETISFNIYKDIAEYVKQNQAEYDFLKLIDGFNYDFITDVNEGIIKIPKDTDVFEYTEIGEVK